VHRSTQISGGLETPDAEDRKHRCMCIVFQDILQLLDPYSSFFRIMTSVMGHYYPGSNLFESGPFPFPLMTLTLLMFCRMCFKHISLPPHAVSRTSTTASSRDIYVLMLHPSAHRVLADVRLKSKDVFRRCCRRRIRCTRRCSIYRMSGDP
jgi:hypothetical protein